MELSGKIIQKFPLQSGESKTSGKPWQLQAYLLETQEQYARKVYFEIFGEQRIKDNPCEIDDLVTISFDIESREYNGRWYTSIRGWKAEAASAPTPGQTVTPSAAAAAPAPQTAGTPVPPAANPVDMGFAATAEETDDLPF